jgi:hypothetical protein
VNRKTFVNRTSWSITTLSLITTTPIAGMQLGIPLRFAAQQHGAFGFNHGGNVKGYSFRGRASFGGGFIEVLVSAHAALEGNSPLPQKLENY